MNLPMFVRATGEPWEVSIQYNTWKRKLLAVCETVCSAFAKFVSGQFASAHQRHEAQMAGSARQLYEEVPSKYKEYEARLVVGLLRILPQDVKNGAEDTNVSITSISLLEELVNVIQPGGKEEVARLLRDVRGLDPANTAKEALETLRRWRIARARATALNLPPASCGPERGSQISIQFNPTSGKKERGSKNTAGHRKAFPPGSIPHDSRG